MLMEKTIFMNGNTLIDSSKGPKAESVDPEIDKIAKQIKEVNARKMVQMKQTVVISTIQKKLDTTYNKPESDSCDWHSVQGQFGWEPIGNEFLPYIMRSGEKYVSERMAKRKLFLHYSIMFTNEIWEYTPIKMVSATAVEAKLLEEINTNHCDGCYGDEKFTDKDNIYPLDDAIKLDEYLSFCADKLNKGGVTESQRCGFIKIITEGKVNLVPYVLVTDKKLVPVFYFDGDCDYLEKGAVELKGWDLAYLKFVCKIQGIRRVLYDKEMVEVVELEYLKKFFLPGTKFEIGWEIESSTKCDLLKISHVGELMAHYTTKPPVVQVKKSSEIKMPVPHVKSVPQTGPYQRHRHRANHHTNYNVQPQMSGQQVQMRHQLPIYPQQMQYQQRVPQVYPTNYNPRPNSGTQNGFSAGSVRQYAPGTVNMHTNNRQQGSKYIQIREPAACNPSQYFLSPQEVDGKALVGCINMDPFSKYNLLVSMEELSRSLFHVDLRAVKNALSAMCLDIYRPNSEQLKVLRSINLTNTEGLIKLNSLCENLPQINYILGNK